MMMHDEEAHTARHEAAHAVVAHALGFRVEYLTLETWQLADGRIAGGGCRYDREARRHYGIQDELAVALAGGAAAGWTGCEGDAVTAGLHYADHKIHLAHLGRAEKQRRYDEAVATARRILREHGRAVDAVARRLLAAGKLTGQQFRETFNDVRLGRIAA